MSRTWPIRATIAVSTLLLCFSFANAQGPATAPADHRFDTLIHQLGDEDFKVRDEATARLAKAGEDARAALTQAASSDDPEVRWRAADLLKQLDQPTPANSDDGLNTPPDAVRIFVNGGQLNIINP